MHIKRIAVESWRGLTCELDDLAPGLNLICGPNESGKSRLVQALRFALFESSKGRARHKAALSSWGAAGERPRVEVEFQLGGATWMLEKTYLGTGCNTVLRGGGKTLEGEEAEDRLADLMGVSPGGTTELKSSERGIWSLLWVDQGDSREPPSHNDISQARLQDQLSAEIGEVAAGELGQRILAAARELKTRFYTDKTDAERPVLRDGRARVEQLEADLAEAEARHRAVARDADDLERLRREERDLEERAARAEAELSAAGERHRQAAEAVRQLDVCNHQMELCRLELERREQALAEHTRLSEEIRRLGDDIAGLEQAQGEAEAARQQAEQAHAEAAAEVGEADDALAALGGELQSLRRRQKSATLGAELAQLERRVEEAAELTARMEAIRGELAALAPVTAEDVERLRAARQAVEGARARLEGASATVELHAQRDLEVDGRTLAAGETHTLLAEDEKHLEIAGVASLVIRPGGGELARLRDALADAERAQASLLESLAVADVQEADGIAQRRRDLQSELKRLRETLARLLPEGRDEIDARIREIRAQLDAAREDAEAGFDPAVLEQAEARERGLAARREALRAQRDARAEALAKARERVRTLEIQRDEKRRQIETLRERHSRLPAAAELERDLEEARRTWSERVGARDAAQRRYEELGGEQLELELRQAEQAVQQLRQGHREVQQACIHIEGRLGSIGDDGRYERVQDLEAELNQARADLARLEREAHAARRLYQVLGDEYQGARERLTEPVIARIRPYLADLFPGSEVWLDEEMNLLGMRGERVEEDFESLSGGAREQLALLVRIGLAEVVGADESWPLVLDDVLVNTDAERIRRVQRLLYQAARNMQILLFTCHGPLFDLLGPDRRIELPPAARRAAGG